MSTPKANTEQSTPATTKIVELDYPIQRGETQITSIILRRPSSGELRGIKLQSLLETDVNSVIKVLPRLTVPALTEQEVASLDPADLWSLASELVVFFMTKSMAADLEKISQ
jgi:hypothetical protein